MLFITIVFLIILAGYIIIYEYLCDLGRLFNLNESKILLHFAATVE